MLPQEEVTGFVPRPHDLDYPAKLERLANEPQAATSHADADQQPLVTSNGSASGADASVSSRRRLP